MLNQVIPCLTSYTPLSIIGHLITRCSQLKSIEASLAKLFTSRESYCQPTPAGTSYTMPPINTDSFHSIAQKIVSIFPSHMNKLLSVMVLENVTQTDIGQQLFQNLVHFCGCSLSYVNITNTHLINIQQFAMDAV